MTKCPYCHPYTKENANKLTLDLAEYLNNKNRIEKPVYVCRALGEHTPFILVCYKNSQGKNKMKLFNFHYHNPSGSKAYIQQDFIEISNCPMCGRELDKDI